MGMGRSLGFLDDGVDMDMLEDNMTDQKLVERAREITSKHLQRPDWIDIGYKDCFVCGTPLDKDEFNKRSASLVGEIAKALQSHGEEVRRKTVEECAKVAETTFCSTKYDGVVVEIATAIRNRMKEKSDHDFKTCLCHPDGGG